MSSKEFATALDLRPRPSKWLACILLAFHAIAAAVVIAGVPNRWLLAASLVLIAASAYGSHHVHVLRRSRKLIRRALWQPDGRWLLEDNAGVTAEAKLLPCSYLHPRLVILNFALLRGQSRRNLILLPDSLDFNTLRQLRARLRVTAQQLSATRLNEVH
ncbi:MAG: protein YgfX [Nevskiales bacterium]